MKFWNMVIFGILQLVVWIARIVPMSFTYWWTGGLGRVAYRLMKKRRELMMYNLEIALGDHTTEEQREEIAAKCFEHLFWSLGELIHMDQIYENWREHFIIEGDEHVEKVIDQGKGFFVFGGHFGAWTLNACVCYRFDRCPGFNLVARPVRNPYIQGLFEHFIEKHKGKYVSTSGTGALIEERALKGELIGLYMDQESKGSQGIFVDFFGRKASSHVVPGYLAWKNDIPLIPYWVLREKPGKYRVILREPLKYELTDDPDENNRVVTQLIANEVERTIKEYPEQWLWAHNRWRRRPDGTIDPRFERRRMKYKKKGAFMTSKEAAERSKNWESERGRRD